MFLIEEVIGFFEMMDGCVKIFYFKIYGGFLGRCDFFSYMEVMEMENI